jgi:hypothetical protein
VKGDKTAFEFSVTRERRSFKASYNGTIEWPTKIAGTIVYTELSAAAGRGARTRDDRTETPGLPGPSAIQGNRPDAWRSPEA